MDFSCKKIIVFDGLCNYCNWAVNFIIKRDKKALFFFTPYQNKTGKELLRAVDMTEKGSDGIILVLNGTIFTKSDAILEIFINLGFGWKFMKYLKVFPRKLRDWGYSVFSKHRYSLFGKRDACMIPSDELKERFLE